MSSTTLAFEPGQEVGEGFRPTELELVNYYLKLMIQGLYDPIRKIPEVNMCEHEPWDLRDFSTMSSRGSEWYFFSPRHCLKGGRTKRLTNGGFWKSTGKDRKIKDPKSGKEIGKRKILVYYKGRTPHGVRTTWIIHEYSAILDLPNQEDFVLCELIKKPEKNANLNSNDEGEPSSKIASDCGHQILDGNSSFKFPTPISNEGCYLDGYTSTPTSCDVVEPCPLLNSKFLDQDPYQNMLVDYSPGDQNWAGASYTTPAELVVESQFQLSYFGYNQEGYNLNSTPESNILADTMYVPDHGFGYANFIPNQELRPWSNNLAIDTPMQPEGCLPYYGSENMVTSAENIFDGLVPICSLI